MSRLACDGSIAVAGGGDLDFPRWCTQRPVPEWKNLKQISVKWSTDLVGINQKGELVYASNNQHNDCFRIDGRAPFKYWANGYWHDQDMPLVWNHLVDVAAGVEASAGVKDSGELIVGGPNRIYDTDQQDYVPSLRPRWPECDFADVEFIGSMLVAMRADGTLRLFETASNREIDPAFLDALQWTDLVDISVSSTTIIGVRSDGSVVAVSNWAPDSVIEEICSWKLTPCEIDRDIPHEIR